MRKNFHGGFVALISAVIIAAVLLGLSVAASTFQFAARSVTLDALLKAHADALADSCEQAALLRFAYDWNYAPSTEGEKLSVGNDACTITSVTHSAETAHEIFATTTVIGQYHGVETRLMMQTLLRDPSMAWPPQIPLVDKLSSQEVAD